MGTIGPSDASNHAPTHPSIPIAHRHHPTHPPSTDSRKKKLIRQDSWQETYTQSHLRWETTAGPAEDGTLHLEDAKPDSP